VIDTPGRDDRFARMAAQRADTLVTPMNDSFVDLPVPPFSLANTMTCVFPGALDNPLKSLADRLLC